MTVSKFNSSTFNDKLFSVYEKEGVEWEYKVEPLSGDMVVVPKKTEDHEIYEKTLEILKI